MMTLIPTPLECAALLLVAVAQMRMLQASADVSFSAAAVAVVTALLASVVGGLGIVFKAYQSATAARIADLLGQIAAKDRDIDYWRSLSERGTTIAETTAAAYRGRELSNRPEQRGQPHA